MFFLLEVKKTLEDFPPSSKLKNALSCNEKIKNKNKNPERDLVQNEQEILILID